MWVPTILAALLHCLAILTRWWKNEPVFGLPVVSIKYIDIFLKYQQPNNII